MFQRLRRDTEVVHLLGQWAHRLSSREDEMATAELRRPCCFPSELLLLFIIIIIITIIVIIIIFSLFSICIIITVIIIIWRV